MVGDEVDGLLVGPAVVTARVGCSVEGRSEGDVVGPGVSIGPFVGRSVTSIAETVGVGVAGIVGAVVEATQSSGGSLDRSHIPCLIQLSYPDTRAYTAGIPWRPHPEPKLTMPICRPSIENNGPPAVSHCTKTTFRKWNGNVPESP